MLSNELAEVADCRHTGDAGLNVAESDGISAVGSDTPVPWHRSDE
jgi:hypothetical protein